MRYTVVHGPRSGRGRGAHRAGTAIAALQAAGHQVDDVVVRSVDEARAACDRAVGDGVDVLALAGGDGLVGLAAASCAGSSTALGLIPAGTGNDTARSLGIPMAPSGHIATLTAGHQRCIDAISVGPSGRLVVGSVAAGVDARIAQRATRLPKWLGPTVYAAATLPEIPRLRPAQYRLVLDGHEQQHRALVVAVCNLPSYGGGMRIAPTADPEDGWLDVVVITGVRPTQALGLLRGVFTGRHAAHPAVTFTRARQVRIEAARGNAVGDGEVIGPLPVTVTVLPRALQVIVPRPLA